MKVKFRVQNEVVVGLKYLHAVKLKGIRVDRAEEMVGSYAPQAEAYEKKFLPDQGNPCNFLYSYLIKCFIAPSGLLARGTYHVRSKFIDDDGVCHLEWDWSFKIKKDWVADSSDQ